MRTFRTHPVSVGRERSRYLARRFGHELRLARLTTGLTQNQLATVARLGQSIVSKAERGSVGISLEVRCRLAAACGHELGWRLYPTATVSLRDSGQLGMANTLVAAAHPRWTIELERPIAPGDLRAADLLLGSPEELVHVEIERALIDLQAQVRAAQIKRTVLGQTSQRPTRLVIAVPDRARSRQQLASAASVIRRAFPISSRAIWQAIREGHPIGGDGILFLRVGWPRLPAAPDSARGSKPLSPAGRRP